jgi:hypothetical protein
LLALAALPLGIPLLAIAGTWGVSPEYGRQVRLWLGVGTTLSSFALGLTCLGRLGITLRLVFSLVIAGVGYVLAVVAFFGPGTSAWRDFTPPDNRFTVRMPGVPTRSVVNEQLKAGQFPVSIEGYRVLQLPQNVTYSIHHFTLPPQDNPNAFLQSYGQGIAQRFPGANLQPERLVSVNGRDGKEYAIHQFNGVTIVRRLFLVGHSAYLLDVAGNNIGPSSPDVVRFFNSLSIRN